jgi:hypothetical protein
MDVFSTQLGIWLSFVKTSKFGDPSTPLILSEAHIQTPASADVV